MENIIIVLHLLICLFVIGLVIIQDPKSGSGGLWGGGSANSVLGATGAATLANKMTRLFGVFFGVTSLVLSYYFTQTDSSVVDKVIPQSSSSAPLSAPAPTEAPAPAAPTNNK